MKSAHMVSERTEPYFQNEQNRIQTLFVSKKNGLWSKYV